MVCFVLCVYVPQPLDSCEWNGGNVCSSVVKYIRVQALNLDGGCNCVDVLVRIAIFGIQGKVWGFQCLTNLWSLDWEKLMHDS